MNTQPNTPIYAYHEFDDTPRPFDAGRLMVHIGDLSAPIMTYMPVEEYNAQQAKDEPHLSLLFRWAVILHHYGLDESRVQGVAGTLDDLFHVTDQWAHWCLQGVIDLYVQREAARAMQQLFGQAIPYTLDISDDT